MCCGFFFPWLHISNKRGGPWRAGDRISRRCSIISGVLRRHRSRPRSFVPRLKSCILKICLRASWRRCAGSRGFPLCLPRCSAIRNRSYISRHIIRTGANLSARIRCLAIWSTVLRMRCLWVSAETAKKRRSLSIPKMTSWSILRTIWCCFRTTTGRLLHLMRAVRCPTRAILPMWFRWKTGRNCMCSCLTGIWRSGTSCAGWMIL